MGSPSPLVKLNLKGVVPPPPPRVTPILVGSPDLATCALRRICTLSRYHSTPNSSRPAVPAGRDSAPWSWVQPGTGDQRHDPRVNVDARNARWKPGSSALRSQKATFVESGKWKATAAARRSRVRVGVFADQIPPAPKPVEDWRAAEAERKR
eukprot:1107959-Prorocentrum_minimum.AAC.7